MVSLKFKRYISFLRCDKLIIYSPVKYSNKNILMFFFLYCIRILFKIIFEKIIRILILNSFFLYILFVKKIIFFNPKNTLSSWGKKFIVSFRSEYVIRNLNLIFVRHFFSPQLSKFEIYTLKIIEYVLNVSNTYLITLFEKHISNSLGIYRV